MIQFNLLPDVKIDYIKARRAKRMVLVISVLVSGALLTIMVLLFLVVNVFQKQHLRDLDKDIASQSKTLQATPDLNKILTVQNQLESLPALFSQKPVASRLFDYITKTTPKDVTISSYAIDFDAQTIAIEGNSVSLEGVNKYVDTLKFTNFTTDQSAQAISTKAFSNVVLSTFGKDDKGASYHLDLKFDPAIFDVSKAVNLVVPATTTTRSETEKPSVIQPSTSNTKTGR
ncbi:MAG: hypothetical protein JWS12_588 [Candidatus Saccharibacteria bacterium]|nr:hypothetical protein [Candidatus Saccharibacteria bacterium]